MTRRIIPHAAICELCPEAIEPGTEVYADDDTAAVHADCLDEEIRRDRADALKHEEYMQACLDATAMLNHGRLA